MLMETCVGSPRSSSGYGSSEEDHQQLRHHRHHHQQQELEQERSCLRLRRASCSTSPQTPDSCISPSEQTSCLNSPDPFSIDFQSVFESDDVLPDWSNIDGLTSSLETGFDDLSLPAEHWYTDGLAWNGDSEMGTGNTAVCPSGVCPGGVVPGGVVPGGMYPDGSMLGGESLAGVVVKIEPEDSWSGSDQQQSARSPEEGHILVSLLKRSKADLDWITTGETTPASISATSKEYLKPLNTSESLAESVTSSPLQRLKALTNSNVVNHAPAPRVMNAAAGDTKPVINMSSAVNVVRVAVSSQVTTSLVNRPVNSCYYDQTNKRTVVVSKPRTVARSTSLRTVSVSTNSKSITASSRPKTTVITERRVGQLNNVGTSRTSSVSGVRRLRTELDDHRYSTQLPQPTCTVTRCQPTPAKTARLNNKHNNNNTSYSQILSSSCPLSSSILETLLLTSEPLRPNEGSEASLAACGVVVCKSDVSTVPVSSILEHLLTDPTAAAGATGEMSSISCDIETESGIGSSDEAKLSPTSSRDNYSLFSEHLLFDSHGLELFGEEQQTWTPSCLDDRVMSNELEEMMQHEQIQQDENTWLQQYLTDLL